MSDVESDDGKRAAKKRKASRACDRCNVQHQPCDNASPKCSVCERAGTECTYNRPIRKRGPRTGYTAQHGERLWGLVLQAIPGAEDLVLNVLANGTYGDTGVLNADYFKDSEHQSELVGRFNESRLGRFIQTGELPDAETLRNNPVSLSFGTQGPGQQSHTPSSNHISPVAMSQSQSRRSTISGVAKMSPSINPHGAPQNPSDIYTLADDIRKRVSHIGNPTHHQTQESPSQVLASTPDWQDPLMYQTNGWSDNTSSLFRGSFSINKVNGAQNLLQQTRAPALPQDPSQSSGDRNTPGNSQGGINTEFDFPDMNQWYDPIPAETLLNLGFTAGEGMAADFLDLCQNPDPLQSAPISPSGPEELDEEAVWRRLVMRGRFI